MIEINFDEEFKVLSEKIKEVGEKIALIDRSMKTLSDEKGKLSVEIMKLQGEHRMLFSIKAKNTPVDKKVEENEVKGV